MKKKNIVVTGGNRGIGKEICRQLGVLGHTVILTARDLASAETAADEMSGDVRPYKLDVRSDKSAWNLGEKLRQELGHIDVVINNAGIFSRVKMKALDMDDMQNSLDTNLFGAIRVTKSLLPLLYASETPRIINMTSELSETRTMTEGDFASYRLSKAALNNFTMILAGELKHENIAVNAMCPGWVKTDMGGLTAPLSVAEGADTAIWLCTEASVPTGKLFRARKEVPW